MKVKIISIFIILIILVESFIIFDKSRQYENNKSIDCYSIVENSTNTESMDEILNDLEKNNIKLLNITKENGEYLIKVGINENKDEFIQRIMDLNGFLIKDYELKWEDNMVDGTLLLKHSRKGEF